MSEYSSREHPARTSAVHALSLPFLILAAVLIGLGIFGVTYWIVTLDWVYFASVVLLVLGAYMLFTRGTGPDHA